jgi:hypothetical protein
MSVTTALSNDLTWLQKHERLIVCTMLIAMALWLGNRYINFAASRANAQLVVATEQAKSAQLSAQQAATQAAQTAAQYQAMVDVLQKQNATLAQAVTQRDAVLGQAQKAVVTATLPEVATQWQTAIGGAGDIVSSTNGLNISSDGSRRTLSMLLELPVLRADLADETKIAQNTQTELDKSNGLTASNHVVITALNAEIAAQDKQCKADIKAVKADANKGKVKWFKIGFVTGFFSGIWAGHAAGL